MSLVRQFVSQYTFNATADGRDQYNDIYEVTVGRCIQIDGSHRWAVRWMGRSINAQGTWDWEPISSDRTEEWLTAHRFDLETALLLAEEAAPEVVVNGVRAGDVR